MLRIFEENKTKYKNIISNNENNFEFFEKHNTKLLAKEMGALQDKLRSESAL